MSVLLNIIAALSGVLDIFKSLRDIKEEDCPTTPKKDKPSTDGESNEDPSRPRDPAL